MATNSQINYLYKQLYLACRNRVDKAFRDDDEAIKINRDQYIGEKFNGRNYTELSYEELKFAINSLQNDYHEGEPLSFSQLKLIKFYTVGLALIYADMNKYSHKIGDIEQSPEEARKRYRTMFNNKENLPKTLLQALYTDWINPFCNKLLIEGGFKVYVKNDKMLYYEQLKTEAARYLLTRLSKTWAEVGKVKDNNYNFNSN